MSKKKIIVVFLVVYAVVFVAFNVIQKMKVNSGNSNSSGTVQEVKGTDSDKKPSGEEKEKQTQEEESASEGLGKGVSLFNMYTIVGSADSLAETANDVKDNLGVNHKRVHLIMCYGNSESNNTTFLLNGEYSLLKGTFFLTDDEKSDEYNRYVEFYADGEYIGSTSSFKSGVRPEDFELDVTDVDELTVKVIGDCGIIHLAAENLKLYK